MARWEWKQLDDMWVITLPGWEDKGVRVAVSGRSGGFSQGQFSSLNLAFHVGDDPDTVLRNRKAWLAELGLDLTDVVCAQQVHKDKVAVVNEADRGKGAFDYSTGLPETDAMITDKRGIFLVTFYADCIPVLLFDSISKAIGMAHSGWRGTMARVAAQTVASMVNEFGCHPSNIMAFLGPGIGGCCFEVDDHLAGRARQEFGHSLVYAETDGRLHWDLHQTNQLILEQAGLLRENITVCDLCTVCHQDKLYSYRASGGKTGRMGVLLGLI